MLQTEFEFTLPFGYVDDAGTLHREGVMRLATARDEVEVAGDARVRANEAYAPVVLLSRGVTRLGGVTAVGPAAIERLYAADFGYLQELFVRLNDAGEQLVDTECPACGTRFPLDLNQVPAV
jgi:hypothetical protein